MNVDFFLDTNVLLYSFDDESPQKRDTAQELIVRALAHGDGAISWQVVQEFLNVALHKWEVPMNPVDANAYLSNTLVPLCRVFPSPTLWQSALSLQIQSQYRFYDALILASALQCGARLLFSEDLQHERRFSNLELRNPFI